MQRNTWLRPEKGNSLTIRLLIWVALNLGYRVTALLRWPATLYYAAVYSSVRRASWQYLSHLHRAGALRRPHWGMVLRHIHAYSTNTLDRIYLLSGRFPRENLHITGQDILHEALHQNRGCIIMGAHIGSFDALRQCGLNASVPFRMLMYRRFIGATSRFIEALAPGFNADIIELGQPDSMLATLKALRNGEFIGILADRAHNGGRSIPIRFLGEEAPIPAGPFHLARLTGAPVVLVSAIRQKNGTYHIACTGLADTLLPETEPAPAREALLSPMQAYVRWMEELCQRHPYAWFNFFDFWEKGL
ncbi:acyltransferase [Parasaccharibacter sp. TMW 2.1888]|uniref:LpxL/LpxP family acyltransferase n=1 Tax=Parasaccharibacter sp. TMW 2.1888 TaxID=2268025 RepID=UPI0020485D76|nr:acyltransferase [Parasaccharibacter sp. TMW 2.1888]UPO79783.1 acyltransferase [Parasaccharibacter sp. TMW 2.1888]